MFGSGLKVRVIDFKFTFFAIGIVLFGAVVSEQLTGPVSCLVFVVIGHHVAFELVGARLEHLARQESQSTWDGFRNWV